MTLASRLASVFSEPLATRFSKAGRLISLYNAGRPAWTPRRYDELAEEAYQKNVVAYRAIKEISDCIGSVPFLLYRGRGEARTEVEDHPLLALLDRPNPMQSRNQFMQATSGFLMIAGNSYLERVGPRFGPPRELWTKRPDRMRIIPSKKGIPAAYEFSVDGSNTAEWPVNQIDGSSNILHIKTFHPLNDWYGMSAIEAAAYSVDQHNESGKWNMWRLQNDARPSGALTVDPKSATGLSDEEYTRLKDQIENEWSGPENAGRPFLLEGGLQWQEMGLNAQEMDWLQGRFSSAREVASALGMPPQMLGIPGDNTHRNMEEARLWLWEQTVIPMLDLILSELNWWLTPLFGSDLELAFDLDEVPALITRRYMLWDKVNTSDFLMVDEKREAVGYEPLKEISDADLKKNPGRVVLVKKNTRQLGDKDAESTDPNAQDPNMPIVGKPNGKGNGKANAST